MLIRFYKGRMEDKVRITRVDDDGAPPRVVKKTHIKKGGKSIKTYPHGILKGGKTQKSKIIGVKDPAKAPPRKTTLKIMTEKGVKERRTTIRQRVRSMGDKEVRATLQKSGMSLNEKTPPALAKEILESGMEAGMIVAK